MSCLEDFEVVRNNLKVLGANTVKALHRFVFHDAGDRQNRRRLRAFEGFEFDEGSEQYEDKRSYVNTHITAADLTSICVALGLHYEVPDPFNHIFKNLKKGELLSSNNQNDADDDDEDDNDADGNDADGNDANEDEDDGADNNTNDDDDDKFKSFARSMGSVNLSNQEDEGSVADMQMMDHQRASRRARPMRFAMSFRDVEDSIKPFDGKGGMPIETWVSDFEETAAVLYWDELQTFIFAKKSLQGLAKLFILGCKGITTWPKLKKALLDEFKKQVNSREIHKMLTERKMKNGETGLEYLYNMKEIAIRGDVADEALIHYVIDGIKGTHINKQMLYGASNLQQFKIKLRDYENYTATQNEHNERRNVEQKNTGRSAPPIKTNVNSFSRSSKTFNRCYNCGESGHLSSSCTNKNKGTKCFRCNKFGHVSKNCNEDAGARREDVLCLNAVKDTMKKTIKVADKELIALIDTGSMVNVMKENVYEDLQLTKLSESNVVLSGFGQAGNKIRPIGCVMAGVLIDGDAYKLTFCIIPDDFMSVDVVIGTPICEQAEINISASGVKLRKIEVAEIMKIQVQKDDDTIYNIEESASDDVKATVRALVDNYQPKKTKTTNVSMKIVLTDETPIATTPRRLPLTERQIVEKQIDEWLEAGVIEESNSEFSSAIVLVTKKDGSERLCVDYRKLNKVVVRDRFPLPLIEDQLDRLQEAKIFSTIDLKNGFFHVPIDKESKKYTAFVTHNGQYQFRRVPFGLANSPAIFQRFVNAIFRELTQKGIAMPYVDDIIIPAKDEDEALANLKQVLKLAESYGLNLNIKKCHFMKTGIEFLGYHIENQMISPSRAKVDAMLKYPVPKTLKQLESFIGLASYFRKFIPDFSKHAKPLTDLRKKDAKFMMGHEQMLSFEKLKMKLGESPVLKIFNQQHETELHADASADGYGAVLLQRLPEDGNLHPCYYMSKKTSDAERKYTSYELEILAVVEALKKFRVYLLGLKFKIVTDCNAFAKTMEKKDLCTRVARWLLLLQEYEYTIEHRSGNQMRHVDALSRCTIMTINEETTLTKIIKAQREDECLRPIFELLQQTETYNDYYVKSNVLYKLVDGRELLVVPRNLQCEIIRRAHEKGHFAAKKTKDVMVNEYFMEKIDDKIQRVIDSCVECVLVNRKRGKKEGELCPIPKHDAPLHTYHVDHLGPLESTHKMYNHLFVVIDAFTKFCWLYPTKTTATKEVVAKLQLQSTTFGNPAVIISDRGTAFTSEEFRQYCDEEGIKHHVITTGLPRANGQVERLNSTIISVLAKMSVEEPAKWYKYVERVQKVINSTVQRSINTTPFELMIGRPMQHKDDLKIRKLVEEQMIREYEVARDQLRQQAKQQIQKVQEENRHTYNLRRRAAPQYLVGELVAVKRTQFGPGLKLRAKYLGPYRVTAAKSNNTYDVVKEGEGEGPKKTTTCAEYMKKWPNPYEA